MRKQSIVFLLLIFISTITYSQSLMYHSLSSDGYLWSGRPEQSSILNGKDLNLYLLSPRLILSGNTAYDRSELSDGSWWQGRGFNGFLTGGLQFDSEYFDITLMPEIWFAQNLPYDILPAVTDSPLGYFMGAIDLPQRMGDQALYEFNWGQTDIRFNWRNLTLGFSNENMLWGPSKVNSLMMSDNASGFPHIDFGLKKTATLAGDFELYAIRGMVEESDFYDSDPDNNRTFISGVTTGYSPFFVPGLTLGIKWTLMTNWENWEKSWQLQLFGYDFANKYFGGDQMDMKGSVTLDWTLPEVGFEWYFEYFREDYSPSLRYIFLAPGHAAGWTAGGEKEFKMNNAGSLKAVFEWNQLIQSRDYEIDLGAGGIYYTHGRVPHGFTNLGQLLGAGIGGGSDAETFMLDYFDTWGSAGLMLQRIGWNKMYLYRDPHTVTSPEGADYVRLNTELNLGVNGTYLLFKSFNLFGGMIFSYNLNYNYEKENDLFNFYFTLGIEYKGRQ